MIINNNNNKTNYHKNTHFKNILIQLDLKSIHQKNDRLKN